MYDPDTRAQTKIIRASITTRHGMVGSLASQLTNTKHRYRTNPTASTVLKLSPPSMLIQNFSLSHPKSDMNKSVVWNGSI